MIDPENFFGNESRRTFYTDPRPALNLRVNKIQMILQRTLSVKKMTKIFENTTMPIKTTEMTEKKTRRSRFS